MSTYTPGRHYNPDTGRHSWAVLDQETRVWYFPKKRGLKPAQRMAKRLNRGEK